MAVSTDSPTQGLLSAGDIEIQEVVIINAQGQEVDVKLFVGELNIFEDMYATGLAGNLLMIDANNVNNVIGIIGDEYLRIKLKTPTMDDKRSLIHKTFKIYSVTDRMMISDSGKQSYILHFCSPEVFIDIMSPLYRTFRGPINNVVNDIFDKYIAVSRNSDSKDVTPLVQLGTVSNEVTFTSPGWTPFKCINWLASKSIPDNSKAPGFLLFESSKNYYFANVEKIIDQAVASKSFYNVYTYGAANLTADLEVQRYVNNVDDNYSKIEDFSVVQNFNHLKNAQSGYLANRFFTLDFLSKEYTITDYDHVDSYADYAHLENIGGIASEECAPFSRNALRSTLQNLNFYPKHKYLYNDDGANVSDLIEESFPRRLSILNELQNFKIEITVPGRTDCEVGNVIALLYPDARPRDESDKAKLPLDELYSGYYLITAVRHKINLSKHMMILELVKDSLRRRPF